MTKETGHRRQGGRSWTETTDDNRRRSTGTATLKVKLLQQVESLREAVLQEIFLYLHKSYDALDSSRCMGILERCSVGTRVLCLLCRYW